LKRSTLVLVAVLVAAAGVHFSVAWQDLPTLARNGYLYDDSFYAFQIARSIAAGHGPTFDGTTLTNGFQPLYVVLLVPFYWLSGGDAVLPIHLALVLLSLLTVATAFVLQRILVRYVSNTIATAMAAIWVLSPIVIRQTANGLETALAVFLFAVSVYYYLSRVRDVESPPRSSLVRLGALLGLTVLARLDQGFLVLAIALDYLLLARARRRRAGAGDTAAMLGTALAVYSPWLVYGWFAVGRLLPESGAATRFLSLAYAPFFGMGSSELITSGPDGAFVANHLARAASVLKLTPATHVLFRAIERAGFTLSSPEATTAASNIVGIVLLLGLSVWLLLGLRSRETNRAHELSFLLLFSVSLIAAYVFYIFGSFFFLRYLYPVHFVATIFIAIAVADLVALARRPLVRRALATTCALYLAGLLYMGYNCCFRSTPVYHFYDIARWVEANTSEDETIGVFQSGTIGYLSNRRVVNLDGKVNGEALSALRQGRLEDYINGVGVDVLLDHTKVIQLFLGDEHRYSSGTCFTGASSGLPGWIGYRIRHTDTRSAQSGSQYSSSGSSQGH
jgi:hypothetical protein